MTYSTRQANLLRTYINMAIANSLVFYYKIFYISKDKRLAGREVGIFHPQLYQYHTLHKISDNLLYIVSWFTTSSIYGMSTVEFMQKRDDLLWWCDLFYLSHSSSLLSWNFLLLQNAWNGTKSSVFKCNIASRQVLPPFVTRLTQCPLRFSSTLPKNLPMSIFVQYKKCCCFAVSFQEPPWNEIQVKGFLPTNTLFKKSLLIYEAYRLFLFL